MRSYAPLLSLAFLCAACDPPTPAATSSSGGPTTPPASTSGAVVADPATPTPPAPTTPLAPVAPPAAGDLAGLAKGNNALAFDLYGKARAQAGNVALSPISISTALTMTWAGAKGETAAQMKKVLHTEGEADKAMDISGKLVASFGNADSKVTLRVANRLFGEKTYAFEQGYLDRTRAAFGAPLEGLDFKHAADPSRIHINQWVATQTQDRIKDLIPPKGIDGETRLVLTNAIYFLGDWMSPFDKDRTKPAAFHATASDTKDVPTMSQTEHFRFLAQDGVKILEMPYQGGEVAMDLVLPDAPAGLDAVEKQLGSDLWTKWVGALAFERVTVALPKFEINPAAPMSLGDTLVSLGMPLAFDRAKADFTGIANPPNPADRLFISKVFHKAFVKLDEKGTEAAAATAVVMARAGSAAPSKPPAEFKADHPFLFVLRQVKSGAILFMGRVSDPSAK
ncbi:MAG: serpin family protein [Byssovorax sp.]